MGYSAENSFRIILGVFFGLFILCLAIMTCRYRSHRKVRRAEFRRRYGTTENFQHEHKKRTWRMFGLELPEERPTNQPTTQSTHILPEYEDVIDGTDGGRLVPRRQWGEMDGRILQGEAGRQSSPPVGDLESGIGSNDVRQERMTWPTPAVLPWQRGDGFEADISHPVARSYGSLPPYSEVTPSPSGESQSTRNPGHGRISIPERTLSLHGGNMHEHRRYASEPISARSYRSRDA